MDNLWHIHHVREYQSLHIKKMLEGSEEKIMCHTSGRFHVIILITWNLTDTRRSKNIQKKRKIRIQHRPDKQGF